MLHPGAHSRGSSAWSWVEVEILATRRIVRSRMSGLRDDGVMMQQQGTPGMCGVSEFQVNILPKGVDVFTHLCNPHPASFEGLGLGA